jgi:DtxR family Mn-dependent transcriptional regulator
MYTVAEENYIKSIYHLQRQQQNVSTNALSARLQTRPASVTDMLKKLEAKKLLTYEKYYGCRLTAAGSRLALNIIRRHRLWEYFLSEKLGFGWEEVHEIAEQLEHVQSTALTEKLDAFLGFPRFDPHGDPIPDGTGKMSQQWQLPLCEWPVDKPGLVSAGGSQDERLLEMLSQKKLHIGAVVVVVQQFAFDRSLEIRLEDGCLVHISEQLGKFIFIKKQ